MVAAFGRGAKTRGDKKLSPHAPESQRLGLLRLRPDPVGRGPTAFGDSFSSPFCNRIANGVLHYRAPQTDVKRLGSGCHWRPEVGLCELHLDRTLGGINWRRLVRDTDATIFAPYWIGLIRG